MLGDVEVAEIDFRACGRWSQLQRVLECVEGARKVLLGNADDAEKVEAFIELLKPIGIREIVRTGTVAMTRVAATKEYQLKGNEETFSQLTLDEKV